MVAKSEVLAPAASSVSANLTLKSETGVTTVHRFVEPDKVYIVECRAYAGPIRSAMTAVRIFIEAAPDDPGAEP